jgi:4a-hydroxytetrahydrobiopterin dehydratase
VLELAVTGDAAKAREPPEHTTPFGSSIPTPAPACELPDGLRSGIVTPMSVPEGWREEDAALVREFELDSFPAAIAFVQRLADLAERENHHPDMDIRYRRVVVHWSTHSAGGVTDRDRELAARTSELAG